MSRRSHIIAALACALVLVGGCSPDAPDPNSTPSPQPTVQPTPPESSAEREQRIAYAAAEKSYRAFMAEINRLGREGGASQPTARMKETAAGPYLKFQVVAVGGGAEAQAAIHRLASRSGTYDREDFEPDQLILERVRGRH